MEAADEWMNVCGADIFVNTEPGGVPLREVQTATGLEGYTQGNTIVSHKTGRPTSMEVTSSAPDRPGTMRHEMGHALGLGHYAHGVMRAPHVPGTRVTKEDCEHLKK
jgi:predicted Zn-dependent protease